MRKGAKTDQKLSPVGKNSKKTFIVLKTKFAMKEKFDQATLTFFIHPLLPPFRLRSKRFEVVLLV